MTYLLAIETSASACSVALSLDGPGSPPIERADDTPRQHARHVLPMVRSCLAEAGMELGDLDALAFGRGPGSFTGVRIATGVVQGLAFGAGLPVIPVSSMAAHAAAAWRRHGWDRVLVCLDARRDEVYLGAYRVDAGGVPRADSEDRIVALGEVEVDASAGWRGVGTGWQLDALAAPAAALVCPPDTLLPYAVDLLPNAREDWAAGRAVEPESALPLYLRGPEAWKR